MHLQVAIQDLEKNLVYVNLPVSNRVFKLVQDESEWTWDRDQLDAYKIGDDGNIVWLKKSANQISLDGFSI